MEYKSKKGKEEIDKIKKEGNGRKREDRIVVINMDLRERRKDGKREKKVNAKDEKLEERIGGWERKDKKRWEMKME